MSFSIKPLLALIAAPIAMPSALAAVDKIFYPSENQEVATQFNIVVHTSDNCQPGKLTISSETDCDNPVYEASTWVKVEDWWQQPVTLHALQSGVYYWRIENEPEVHCFMLENNNDAVAGIDTYDYGVFTSNSGANMWIHNRWAHSADFGGTKIDHPYTAGMQESALTVHNGLLYIAIQKPDEATSGPQCFNVYDVFSGQYEGQVEITLATALKNRRYDECGHDEAGNFWAASSYNPACNTEDLAEQSHLAAPRSAYYKLLTGQPQQNETKFAHQQCVRLLQVSFDDTGQPKVKTNWALEIPDLRTSSDPYALRTVSGVKVWGDMTTGKFEVTAQYAEYNTTLSGWLTICTWQINGDEGNTMIKPTTKRFLLAGGIHPRITCFDKNTFLVKTCDKITLTDAGSTPKVPAVTSIGAVYLVEDATTASPKLTKLLQLTRPEGSGETEYASGNDIVHFSMGQDWFVLLNTRNDVQNSQYTLYHLTYDSQGTPLMIPVTQLPKNGMSGYVSKIAADYRRLGRSISKSHIMSVSTQTRQNISDNRRVAQAMQDAMQICIYTPAGTLASYRIQPMQLTHAPDAETNKSPIIISTSHGVLNITIADCQNEHLTFDIYDTSGKPILTKQNIYRGQTRTFNLAKGIYCVKAKDFADKVAVM